MGRPATCGDCRAMQSTYPGQRSVTVRSPAARQPFTQRATPTSCASESVEPQRFRSRRRRGRADLSGLCGGKRRTPTLSLAQTAWMAVAAAVLSVSCSPSAPSCAPSGVCRRWGRRPASVRAKASNFNAFPRVDGLGRAGGHTRLCLCGRKRRTSTPSLAQTELMARGDDGGAGRCRGRASVTHPKSHAPWARHVKPSARNHVGRSYGQVITDFRSTHDGCARDGSIKHLTFLVMIL